MNIAIPRGGEYDGVELRSNVRTPFPENSIHPIINWEEIKDVPGKYLQVIDGSVVTEMSETNKLVVDNLQLDTLKQEKIDEIDKKTSELITGHFDFVCPDGVERSFSFSSEAQLNWTNMYVMTQTGGDKVEYPLLVVSYDDQLLQFENKDEVSSFYFACISHKTDKINSGAVLKLQVKNVKSKQELDSIKDER